MQYEFMATTRKLPDYRKRTPGGGIARFQSFAPSMNRERAALSQDHYAIIEGTTIFQRSIRTAAQSPRVLVSGDNNGKLGGSVRKGPWKGAAIYHLTLVERETCPRTCAQWDTCYGNTMLLARRHRYGPDLIEALDKEIADKARQHRRLGFVVRLHTLGDFPDPDYVRVWLGWVKRHPGLRVFGYTARARDSEIGRLIEVGNSRFPHRWAIRFSVAPEASAASRQATTIWSMDEMATMPRAIICPAQRFRVRPDETDKPQHMTQACATCGLCWHPSAAARRIVFLGHGMNGRRRAAQPGPAAPAPIPRHRKPSATVLTRQDIAKVREAIAGGIAPGEVATRWGISQATVARLMEPA